MATKPVSKGDAIELNLDSMTVEQGLSIIETERVRPLLNYLRTGVFENKTNMSYMKAYSVVVQFGDQQAHSCKLYNYYKRVIREYSQENVQLVLGCSGEEFLRRLADFWGKQTMLVYWMQRVFQYLDRFFTQNTEYPDLFLAALRSFEETVYRTLGDKCISALIAAINRERDGGEIDQDVVRHIVEMLYTVGCEKRAGCPEPRIQRHEDHPAWQSSSTGVYKTDFEPVLLAATAEYYRARVAGWLAECSCPRFVEEASRRLDSEERRLDRYLHRSSEQELRAVVQREVILNTARQLVEMDTGCQAMFQNRRYDELTLMYRLFRREPSMLPHITAAMQPYIEERCAKTVGDPQMIEKPELFVKEVLELKAELDEMVARCFDNDSGFQKARNSGLELVLNRDTRCSKYLAVFCDHELKKGLRGRNEEEVVSLVNQVVSLFAHLKDKDIFLDVYKRALSRRLLNKLSVSSDAEDAFIQKLKVECGQQAIQKLASMFTDMALSDQLQDEYNRLSHGGAPGGIAFEVRILQTNAWPEKADDVNIVPCEEMVTCVQTFESFYHSKHSGRKLRWIYSMGSVELTATCFQKKHILVVSAYQCLALMLFNREREVTFSQICDATALPKEECKRQVLSMTAPKHRLLLKSGASKELEDDSKIEVNAAFASDKIKVVVGLIKKEEKAAETAVAEAPTERRHVIDAALVRIMKSRKKLDHNSLLEEVFRQCTLFKPQPSQIKTQIEHLIDREFLKRDAETRNVYVYLP